MYLQTAEICEYTYYFGTIGIVAILDKMYGPSRNSVKVV